jgi:Helix-turn-helix domain
MAAACAGTRGALWFDLHRRVRARPCGSARRPPGDDALAERQAAGRSLSPSGSRARPHLHSRPEADDIGRGDGRHRSRACAGRRASRTAGCGRCGEAAGRGGATPGRPIAIQSLSDGTCERGFADRPCADACDGAHRRQAYAAIAGGGGRHECAQFGRAFAQATGITPHEFVEQARIDAARRLLEGSDRPLKAVAFDCGFGSADRMRIVFSERLGVSPAHYRASFRKV